MSEAYNSLSDKHAEFDEYARGGYRAGMESVVKRLIGGNFEAFIAVKVRWLIEYLRRTLPPATTSWSDLRLLDFGCGNGELLHVLQKMGFNGALTGCDISEKMLKEAAMRRDWA